MFISTFDFLSFSLFTRGPAGRKAWPIPGKKKLPNPHERQKPFRFKLYPDDDRLEEKQKFPTSPTRFQSCLECSLRWLAQMAHFSSSPSLRAKLSNSVPRVTHMSSPLTAPFPFPDSSLPHRPMTDKGKAPISLQIFTAFCWKIANVWRQRQ